MTTGTHQDDDRCLQAVLIEPQLARFRQLCSLEGVPLVWESYASARGSPLPAWWAVHLCFCVRWADWFIRRPEPTPWQRGRLATILELLRRLEEAAVL